MGSLQPPTRAPPLQHRHLPPSPPARVSSRVGLARVGMGLGGHPRPPKNKGEGVPPSPFSAVVRGGVVDDSVPRHIFTFCVVTPPASIGILYLVLECSADILMTRKLHACSELALVRFCKSTSAGSGLGVGIFGLVVFFFWRRRLVCPRAETVHTFI